MEKQYKDINLKVIRETAKIDFAHFTYQKGQCSCCYGPLKLPARYWTGGQKTKEYFEDNPNEEYSYILFKNAYNGSGTVTKEDLITNRTYISYGNLTDGQMNVIIEMLQSQLGEGYEVIKPESKFTCIEIVTK